jgi:hypothetical protein
LRFAVRLSEVGVAHSKSYLEALRAALDDLPADAQAELLADFDEQVAMEYGTAQVYGAALRAAAGYPPQHSRHRSLETRRRRSRLVKLLRALGRD